MKFCGYGKVFSTVGDDQYNTIGDFWDKMSRSFGLENLRGVGFNWTKTSMEYLIGLKDGIIDTMPKIDGVTYKEVELPDGDWQTTHGLTDELPSIYREIYRDGALKYEIESFFEDGRCVIEYYR